MSVLNWLKFIVLGIIWGSSFFWIKIGLEELSPVTLVAYRALFAFLGLLVVTLLRRSLRVPRRFWFTFFVLGIINISLPFTLIFWSEQYIPSGLASVLNSTTVLFTTMISPIFVAEDRLTWPKLAGVLIGFVGIIVLMLDRLGQEPGGYFGGIGGMLLGSLSYSSAAIYARRKTQGMTPDVQGFGQLLMATLVMVPAAALLEPPFQIPHQPSTWAAVLWLGLMGSCIATMLYFSLINTVGPTRTMLTNYIFPLVGVILGVVFLGETPGWRFFVGGALIVSGVVIVNLRWGRRKHVESPST